MEILWYLPTHGDSRYLASEIGSRPATKEYIQQIAEAAERLGYKGVLIPTGQFCEDAWVTAASLIPVTNKLKFLVALRPGITQPSFAARMAATLDRLSNGRLLINVVTGGDPVELAGDSLFLDHDERYELTDEYLTIWKKLLQGEEVTFQGKYLQVEKGKQLYPPVQNPYPPLYFGGSSAAAHRIAGKHVDHYLSWGEPPQQVREKIAEVKREAEAHGRTVRFGIRLNIIARETNEEAWKAAYDLIRYVDDQAVHQAQQVFSRYDSIGQQRMVRLHNGKKDSLEISPNLWAGLGLVRSGAGTALVGDGQTVAQRLLEYADLGIESFVLSGYPHLEEAYRVAELVFPHLPNWHQQTSLPGESAAVDSIVHQEWRSSYKTAATN